MTNICSGDKSQDPHPVDDWVVLVDPIFVFHMVQLGRHDSCADARLQVMKYPRRVTHSRCMHACVSRDLSLQISLHRYI